MRILTLGRAVLAGGILLAACAGAGAEGFRNIASVTGDAYFQGDNRGWRLETTDVFLARILPAWTAVVKLTRLDSELDSSYWYQHVFSLGPVVSFTDTLYLEAVYGLGIDSGGLFTHKFDLNFNHETDATTASLGLRADWLPASRYFYFLPSISGKFHPLPALGLLGKFFLSVDSGAVLTESFWGQADYRFSPLFGARAGFTMNHASTFGYSVAAGLDFFFRRPVSLKYTFQFLSDSIDLSGLGGLEPRSGISNALVLDVRF
jgi:hypothetical protein